MLVTRRGQLMHGICGLGTTNMVFITLIQALCQQSFGLTLPQNCVRPSGPEQAVSELACSAIFLTLVRTVRMGPTGQRGKKSHQNGPHRETGTCSVSLRPASEPGREADLTQKAVSSRLRKQPHAPAGS